MTKYSGFIPMKRLLVALFLLAFGTVGCMSVPDGLQVIVTDNPEPYCMARANCYSVEHRAIVVVPNQSLLVYAHELCHAHQHQQVLDELGREPRRDLAEWYYTDEAREYAATVGNTPVPGDWRLSAPTLLEDFATSCSWYLVTGAIKDAPEREAFFAKRNFR